ncbi:MAG: TrkA C-terminal domain-containing protein, partial [Bacteroidota bacterium]
SLQVSELVIFLGLGIFVYTVALQSGPVFFASLRKHGFRDIGFVFLMLMLAAAATASLHYFLGFDAATTAGLFSGITTNTPALAGLIDLINHSGKQGPVNLSQLAVVGYSLGYPMGVLGVMLTIKLMERWLRIDYTKEAEDLQHKYPIQQSLERITVRVTQSNAIGTTLRDLHLRHGWKVMFGRMRSGDTISLPNWDTQLQQDDLLNVVASPTEIKGIVADLGEATEEPLSLEHSQFETKRIFVSNAEVTGERLASLNIPERFSARITRIQRGDIDLHATGDTILELGDQVRVVTRKNDLPGLQKLFGDSYERLCHINLLSFGSGMAIGLLLGMITFQLTDEIGFRLGFAGGPLIVGLILGYLRRTGPIVWTMSYSTNLTLRQFGLMLLLAGVGINSGHTFLSTLQGGSGGLIFAAGAVISILSASLMLVLGYKLLKIPFTMLIGMVSNQPAILDFAMEQSKNKLPMVGFTLMMPITLITKILIVQLLFILIGG